MSGLNFEWPWMLILLVILPIWWILFNSSKKNIPAIKFSRLAMLEKAAQNKPDYKRFMVTVLFIIATVSGIFALARPQMISLIPVNPTKVMLLLDISISMEAKDMNPNRLTVAKETAIDFIRRLPKGVKSGLGFFYGSAYIPVEPTLDRDDIIQSLSELSTENLLPGTAIGTAIDAAEKSLELKKDKKSDLSIILLTDGESNQGIPTDVAARKARKMGIKIFTIGIGSREGAIVNGGILSSLDEGALMEIANITNAKFFRAESRKELKDIYKQLNLSAISLEKRKLEITFLFSGLSLLCFLIVSFLNLTILRIN